MKLPLWKKLLFAAVASAAVMALAELLLMAIGIRPVLFDEDPYVGFSGQSPLFVEHTAAHGAAMMATAANKLDFFNHQQFPRDRRPGVRRIFCIGGSTTYGRPYDDGTSFCGWLRAFLAEAGPSREWEVINAGGLSYASYRTAAVMEELVRYEPDLFVIYSGHNEFLERRTYANIIRQPAALRWMGAWAARMRIYTVLRRGVNAARRSLGSPRDDRAVLPGEVSAQLDEVVGPQDYARDDMMQERVIEHFGHNLSRMVDIARSAGAAVVLVVPAANLGDCSPFKSQHRDGLTARQRLDWQRLFKQARDAHGAGKHKEELEALDEASTIDGRYAHLHYRRGRGLRALGQYGPSRKAFQRALDEDVCPLRVLSPIQRIVREVAADRQVPLVDFAALVESRSEHGIPGQGLFLDHIHPTVDGNRMLALAILDRLVAEEAVTLTPQWNAAAIERVSDAVKSRLDPKTRATALLNLSKVLGWAGKFEDARRLTRQVLDLDRDNPEAHYNLGVTLQQMGKSSEAAEHFSKLIELRPGLHKGYYGLGCTLLAMDRLEESEAQLAHAVRIEPDDEGSHFSLGEVRLRQGKREEALAHFRKALELNPHWAVCHVGIARILDALGEYSQAVVHVKEAVALRPHDVSYRLMLATGLAHQGKFDAAVRQFRRAIEIAPDHVERAWRSSGETQPAVLDAVAAAFAAAERFDEAAKAAKEAMRLAESSGQRELAMEIGARLKSYETRVQLSHR